MPKIKNTYLRDGRAPIPNSEITSRVMSSNKAKDTKPELLFRKALWNNGIKGYRINLKTMPGRPDIAFPSKKLALFITGCFWHRCEKCCPNVPKTNIDFWTQKFIKNKERDWRKTQQIISIGWTVMVIWECEIKTDLQGVVEKVKNKFFK